MQHRITVIAYLLLFALVGTVPTSAWADRLGPISQREMTYAEAQDFCHVAPALRIASIRELAFALNPPRTRRTSTPGLERIQLADYSEFYSAPDPDRRGDSPMAWSSSDSPESSLNAFIIATRTGWITHTPKDAGRAFVHCILRSPVRGHSVRRS